MNTPSHLSRACLRTLDRCADRTDADGWVTRADFDAALLTDEWVTRNQHRLARLDFTLIGLSSDNLVDLRPADGAVRAHAGAESLA